MAVRDQAEITNGSEALYAPGKLTVLLGVKDPPPVTLICAHSIWVTGALVSPEIPEGKPRVS